MRTGSWRQWRSKKSFPRILLVVRMVTTDNGKNRWTKLIVISHNSQYEVWRTHWVSKQYSYRKTQYKDGLKGRVKYHHIDEKYNLGYFIRMQFLEGQRNDIMIPFGFNNTLLNRIWTADSARWQSMGTVKTNRQN